MKKSFAYDHGCVSCDGKILANLEDNVEARIMARKLAEKYAKRRKLKAEHIPSGNWRKGIWVIS